MGWQRAHHPHLVLDQLNLLRVLGVDDDALDGKLALRAVGLPLMHAPDGRIAALAQLLADRKGAPRAARRLIECEHPYAQMTPAECGAPAQRQRLLHALPQIERSQRRAPLLADRAVRV